MQIGDLVYDRSICMHGIIVDTKGYVAVCDGLPEFEHTIMYSNGTIDTAYEEELWLENDENESW